MTGVLFGCLTRVDIFLERVHAGHPDFGHKAAHLAICRNSELKSPWSESEMAASARGSMQMDLISCNKRLSRYIKAGEYKKTLDAFYDMKCNGIHPNAYSFVPVINACSKLRALEEGRQIHAMIMRVGCEADVYVGSCLIDMYANCGCIGEAYEVFIKMPTRNVVAWSAMIVASVKHGHVGKALELYRQMHFEGINPDSVMFVTVVNACASIGSLEEGRFVHSEIIQRGYESNIFVGSALVDMYVKCRSVEDAQRVFYRMPIRNVVSWSAMILGYAKYGDGQKALELFRQMKWERVDPDSVTFVAVLNACASIGALEEGRYVHDEIIQSGCEQNVFVSNSLIDMYAKCGSMDDALQVFSRIPRCDVIAWTAMILGYVKCGQGQKALDLSWQMERAGVHPEPPTFVGILNACASIQAVEEGRHVHRQIIQSGFEFNILVANSLVYMYAKCGSLVDALLVFDKMPRRNFVSWGAMIWGYVQHGHGQKALELFQKMQLEGMDPDPVTFMALLNACANLGALDEGRHLHEQIIQRGCQSDEFVSSCLIDMYFKCQSIEDAQGVFNNMLVHKVASWNAMILGYARCGEGQKALELFREMEREGVDAGPVTFVAVLNACASLVALKEGRRVHKQIIQSECESNIFVATSLVDMYAKCGSLEEAWRVFYKMPMHDVIAWTVIILGYAKCGQGQKALELFECMQLAAVEPQPITFVGALNACASLGVLENGKQVHEQITQRGWESDLEVGSALIDMYAKCGSIEDACWVFNKMPQQNVGSWNAMLRGYAMHGHAEKALLYFERMAREDVEMDSVTLISVLSACSHAGLVDEGLCLFESMASVYSICATIDHYACIVDLLGRAGHLHEAEELTKFMSCEPNISVWMTLLSACKLHGNEDMAERTAKRLLD